MTMDFVGWALLYTAACIAFAYSMIRFPTLGFAVGGSIALLFPVIADTSDWNHWFDWVKRFSVVVPTGFWAFAHYAPEHRISTVVSKVFPVILIVNMLEAGVLDVTSGSPVNGLLIVTLALTVPITWVRSERLLGFSDVPWQLACGVCLARLYLCNMTFGNSTFLALCAIAIATASLSVVPPHRWIHWRIWTLFFGIAIDSVFPAASVALYPAVLQRENRVALVGSALDYGLVAVGAGLVAWLLVQRVRTYRSKGVTSG